jgi:hypothetical protein
MADLAADEQGRIYVADNANMRLLRLDAWNGPPANPRTPAAAVLAAMAHWAFCKLTAHPQTARSDTSPAWRWARKAKFMYTRPPLRGTWPGLTPVQAAL